MPRKKSKVSNIENKLAPALTPEARENQLIYLATELAEQQLRDGTASSQVITHFLKLGTTREKTEKEMLEKQKELIDAKIKALRTAEATEELYTNAINAMKLYSGQKSSKEIDENYEQQKDIY